MSPTHHFSRILTSDTHRHLYDYPLHRGDPDATDERGLSALHVAAKYGNTAAAEAMLNREKEVNLWGLDNQGRTAARVAALNNRVECCHFLDSLAIRWQMQSPDYATKMQNRAMKDLAKRAEREAKVQKEERRADQKQRPYSHSTAPSGQRGSAHSEMKSSSATQLLSGRRKKASTPAEVLKQNFELRTTSSADHIDQQETASHETSDEEEAGVLRPAGVRTGPLINNLKCLGQQRAGSAPGRGRSQESGLGSETFLPATASTSRRSSGSGGIPELALSSQPIVIENDSPLATFLQSLDLIDHIQLLHREKLDLEALALCEERDLADIGLPLGPRKKLLNAVQRRQALLKKPGRMVDTEL